jgi:hypothetical protein
MRTLHRAFDQYDQTEYDEKLPSRAYMTQKYGTFYVQMCDSMDAQYARYENNIDNNLLYCYMNNAEFIARIAHVYPQKVMYFIAKLTERTESEIWLSVLICAFVHCAESKVADQIESIIRARDVNWPEWSVAMRNICDPCDIITLLDLLWRVIIAQKTAPPLRAIAGVYANMINNAKKYARIPVICAIVRDARMLGREFYDLVRMSLECNSK